MNTIVQQLNTTSSDQTKQVAAELAKIVEGGEVFALHGDLGFGKTTFTQGFAKGLGISQQITSPTFLIVKQYTVRSHPTITQFNHVDLYRLEDESSFKSLGFEEMFADPHAVTFIEWPERMNKLLPSNVRHITFTFVDENTREISII